jgi:hypothetical protein
MTIGNIGFCAALSLCLAAAPCAQAQSAAGAPAKAVKVANQTKQAVVAVYTSIPGRGDWGDDMLGKAKLPAGKTLNLKLIGPAGECMLDFSALLENGDTVVQKAVDVCQAAPQVQF